ncbi:AsmA family protein [Geobacter sp. SVR]|uniref:DUF748 domain-containing protein n=1 Tax=Geobacter sp. SVR TaxID=2495594 RepID=UPI00143EFC20|nr:AsmA family protein [Geobacter sp. SVR]BCS53891.1 hypothetical protein GSVR_21990 [Geobacter sp. SVR]GCF86331.1 cell envelope biogenesis protein AsmA [Geobacter sp. SVR]
MKKPIRIAGIVCAVVAALLLGMFVVAKVVITPERVKATLTEAAERRLHRPVRIGEIDVRIFSGIVVQGLTIMEKDGAQTFVKVEQVKLNYQFWPLFSKRIVVDEIRLDAPHIRVVRMPDNSFNYSDIMAEKPTAPPEKPKQKGGIDLLVSKASLSKGEVSYEDRTGKFGSPFVYTIRDIEFSAKDIAPEKPLPFSAGAGIPGARLEAEGTLTGAATKPAIDAVIRVAEGDLKKLIAGLPAGLAAKAKGYDPGGVIKARLHCAGPVAAPKGLLKDGELQLENVQVSAAGQRPSLTGKLELKGDALSSRDLVLNMGANKLQIALAVTHLSAKPVSITSEIKAERLDLAPVTAKQEPTSPAGGAAAKPEPGPLDLPVRASGTVQLGQVLYKGVTVSNVLLKYRLIDNILTIDQFSGNAAGGTFADTARIDLRQNGFGWSTRLTVRGMQAEQLAAAFAPKASGTLYGKLALNAELAGMGTSSAAIRKSLGGRGDFKFTEGRLTGPGLVQHLALFLNLEQLRSIAFDTFSGTFRIESGRARIESGISGRDVQITQKGTAGLDGSLDLSLVTRLSPQLTGRVAQGDIKRFLTDDKGWGLLPLKVGGTASSPRFGIDASVAGQQLKTRAREKLQQTIEEKFLKKQEGEPKRPEQELLEKGLKGIFGR